MKDRFKPHPKYPDILIGRTYQIRNYQKPWDADTAIEEAKRELEAK